MGKYLQKYSFSLVGLFETKIKETKFHTGVVNYAKGWYYLHNYSKAENGKIWLIWKEEDLWVLSQDIQGLYIYCIIKDRRSKFKCALTVVHVNNYMEDGKKLLEGLHKIRENITDPWCVCGNFNSPLATTDRTGGQAIITGKIGAS